MQANGLDRPSEGKGERDYARRDKVQGNGNGGVISPVIVSPLKMGRHKPFHTQEDSRVDHVGIGEARTRFNPSLRRAEGDTTGRGSRGAQDSGAGERRRAAKVLTFLDPEPWSDEVRLYVCVCAICVSVRVRVPVRVCTNKRARVGVCIYTQYEYTCLPACLHACHRQIQSRGEGWGRPAASRCLTCTVNMATARHLLLGAGTQKVCLCMSLSACIR